jgi:hypothetical protein
MKLVFKVLLLIVLIAVGKWERDQNFLFAKQPKTKANPVYTQHTDFSITPKDQQLHPYKKLPVKYNY